MAASHNGCLRQAVPWRWHSHERGGACISVRWSCHTGLELLTPERSTSLNHSHTGFCLEVNLVFCHEENTAPTPQGRVWKGKQRACVWEERRKATWLAGMNQDPRTSQQGKWWNFEGRSLQCREYDQLNGPYMYPWPFPGLVGLLRTPRTLYPLRCVQLQVREKLRVTKIWAHPLLTKKF